MAPLRHFTHNKKVLLLVIVLLSLFFASMCISQVQPHKNNGFLGRRKLLGLELEDDVDEPESRPEKVAIKKKKTSGSLEDDDAEPEPEAVIKKKSSSSLVSKTKNQTKLAKPTSIASSKNQTKLIKTSTGSSSTKNQTKLIKTPIGSSSTKNQTKLIKSPSDSTKNKTKFSSDSGLEDQPIIKTKLKKLNSTSKSTNSTKTIDPTTKKSSDLTKTGSAKATTSKESKTLLDKSLSTDSKPTSNTIKTQKNKPSEEKRKSSKQTTWPNWVDQDADDDDLVAGFRGLPSKFQETLLPDLERISKTSKVYLTKANKEITRGFKPYVGNKYAPTIASFVSFAFIVIPLILVSLIFNKIKAYFSLQKILIFVQIYLSIYFSILCLSSLITGLEPLRFFYATAQSTYVCLQVLQTLAYVLYLLLLLMYLVLVFSTETGLATKLLGLGQTFVGYAVGLHYYVTVFHKTVLHQPPKTSWKIHAIYATCFLLICVLTRVDRRKKAYLDGDEGKMN